MKRYIIITVIALALAVGICLGALAYDMPWTENSTVIHGPFAFSRPIEGTAIIEPVTRQILPEGCIGYGFETYLTFLNSTDKVARIVIVYSGKYSYYTTCPLRIEPHQRRTLDLEYLLEIRGGVTLESPDVGITILSDTPGIYATESMYWNDRAAGKSCDGFMEMVGE